MKFTSKTDLNASLNATFAAFADFEAFERQGLRAGAEIERIDDLVTPGPGMMWRVKAEYRGKMRRLEIELVDYDPPNMLKFRAASDLLDAEIKIDLIALSAKKTRAAVDVNVAAKSLSGRLLLQTARLAKGNLNRRFASGLNRFGVFLENRIAQA